MATKNRKAYTDEYLARKPWAKIISNAKSRCNNPNFIGYARYGGKGIKFLLTDDEIRRIWERDAASDLIKPSIDRVNPDGDYSAQNCRFIELRENVGRHNREKNRCKRGHEFSYSNTRLRSNGRRSCIACHLDLKARLKKAIIHMSVRRFDRWHLLCGENSIRAQFNTEELGGWRGITCKNCRRAKKPAHPGEGGL